MHSNYCSGRDLLTVKQVVWQKMFLRVHIPLNRLKNINWAGPRWDVTSKRWPSYDHVDRSSTRHQPNLGALGRTEESGMKRLQRMDKAERMRGSFRPCGREIGVGLGVGLSPTPRAGGKFSLDFSDGRSRCERPRISTFRESALRSLSVA